MFSPPLEGGDRGWGLKRGEGDKLISLKGVLCFPLPLREGEGVGFEKRRSL